MYKFHCHITSHSYPTPGCSCTAQATSEHQDTGEVSSPGRQDLPPLCSKLGGTWTAVPAGLICGQVHGDIPVLPSLRVMALLGLSFCVVLCLSGHGLTWVSHHHREERDMRVSGLGRGCR